MPRSCWIITADTRRARLLSCRRTEGGGWQVQVEATLESPWEDYHEHARPGALDSSSAANVGHFRASYSEKERQEEQRRFARDVCEWLAAMMTRGGLEHVDVFAAPGFFGALRAALGAEQLRTTIRQVELAGLRPHELAAHPAVLSAIEPARARV